MCPETLRRDPAPEATSSSQTARLLGDLRSGAETDWVVTASERVVAGVLAELARLCAGTQRTPSAEECFAAAARVMSTNRWTVMHGGPLFALMTRRSTLSDRRPMSSHVALRALWTLARQTASPWSSQARQHLLELPIIELPAWTLKEMMMADWPYRDARWCRRVLEYAPQSRSAALLGAAVFPTEMRDALLRTIETHWLFVPVMGAVVESGRSDVPLELLATCCAHPDPAMRALSIRLASQVRADEAAA